MGVDGLDPNVWNSQLYRTRDLEEKLQETMHSPLSHPPPPPSHPHFILV